MKSRLYTHCFKRWLDAAGALVLLVLLAPLLALIWLVVRAALGAPALFRQLRPGLKGKPFWLLKFRTMETSLAADGTPLPDSERLTSLGRKLRATSLDELPELWNVLKGEMSFVGPRPLLMEYLPLYSDREARRHEVRPGITGWAQVNGRNALTWEAKFELDLWYVERVSLLLDLRILLATVATVTRRDGIGPDGHPTMPRFSGSGRKQ